MHGICITDKLYWNVRYTATGPLPDYTDVNAVAYAAIQAFRGEEHREHLFPHKLKDPLPYAVSRQETGHNYVVFNVLNCAPNGLTATYAATVAIRRASSPHGSNIHFDAVVYDGRKRVIPSFASFDPA